MEVTLTGGGGGTGFAAKANVTKRQQAAAADKTGRQEATRSKKEEKPVWVGIGPRKLTSWQPQKQAN